MPKYNFKIGQTVKTGEGLYLKIIDIDPTVACGIKAVVEGTRNTIETFTLDGQYRVDGSFPEFNIVEIVAEPELGQIGKRVPLEQTKTPEIAALARELFIQDFKLGSDNAASLARSAISAAITFYQEVKNRGI